MSTLTPVRKIEGICLWWEAQCLIRAVGRRIDISRDNGQSFSTVAHLDFGLAKNRLVSTRLTARLLRLNPKHCLRLNASRFVIVAAGKVYLLDIDNKTADIVSAISGSRPLRMAYDGNYLYYGEYHRNADRLPIRIFRSGDEGRSWQVCHTFHGIRHVHGIYFDQYSQHLWITTGDIGNEAAIWKADVAFSSILPVLIGSQQTRAIDLLFTEQKVYFGTDAPEEQNYLYSMDRDGTALTALGAAPGPVFHALNTGEQQYFSTACEPSENLQLTQATLLSVANGSIKQIYQLKKDRYSMKYFQYGQLLFPSGPGVPGQLWCSSFACEQDQYSFCFSLPDELDSDASCCAASE